MKPASNNLHAYLHLLDQFVKTGEVFEKVTISLGDSIEDPLLDFLHDTMSSPSLQAKVLGSRIAARAFIEVYGRFIAECLKDMIFSSQLSTSEQTELDSVGDWADQKREKHWQGLLQQIADKHTEDGFDDEYLKRYLSNGGWRDEDNWDRLKREWQNAIDTAKRSRSEKRIRSKGGSLDRTLDTITKTMQQMQKEEGATEEQMLQAWNRMDGQWSETEFEKQLRIVEIQNKYPQIGEVVRKLGRIPDTEGKDRIPLQTGVTHKLDHSSGSDIQGVTIGNDLGAMMPLERAQVADGEMESLFLRKYLTRRLQIFRYQSEIVRPSRQLHTGRATRQGPVIVCLDTSASMYGPPQRIEASLLSKVEQTIEALDRDCYLIDFSVGVRPIDLHARRRNRSLQRMGIKVSGEDSFAKGYFPFIGGGTDAEKMLRLTFSLLDDPKHRFMNADVLWITDFIIPRTSEELLARFKDYQQTGTHFYGFKIGGEPSAWDRYFDKVYEVHYRQPRRY